MKGEEWGTDKAGQQLGIPGNMASMSVPDRKQAYSTALYASYVARQAAFQQEGDAPVLDVDQIQAQLNQMA